MDQFSVYISELMKASNAEIATKNAVATIENELNSIINTLSISNPMINSVKAKLKTDLNAISGYQAKLQVLSDTLSNIASIYERTENKVSGNQGGNEISSRIDSLSQNIKYAQGLGLCSTSSFSKDPVNLSNGNYIYEKTLLEIDTESNLKFQLFYNARNDDFRCVGIGWIHSYYIVLESSFDKVTVNKYDGSLYSFVKSGEREYTPLNDTKAILTYDGIHHKLFDRNGQTYIFDVNGYVTEMISLSGLKIYFTYENGLLKNVADDNGNTLEYFYTSDKHLSTVSDHTGRTVTLSYDGNKLVGINNPLGQQTLFSYNKEGLLERIKDDNGRNVLINEFDSQRRTVSQTFPDGGKIIYDYIDDKNQVVITEQNGNKISYEHDNLQRNTQIFYSNGTESFTFDDNNNRTSYKDRNGNVSHYGYDEFGNMINFINPLRDTVSISYTEFNQVKSVSLNGDLLHEATYNDNNLQVSARNALGAEDLYGYDDKNQIISWTKADGSKVLLEYDDFGNMTSITNSMGGKTLYSYDSLHRVIETVDPLGNKVQYEYNALDQIIKTVNSSGLERTYRYDSNGNITHIKDYDGSNTSIEYNEINKPSKVTDPEGNITLFEYDKMWNLSKETMPNGGTTKYNYDILNHLVSIEDANGGVNRLEYDSNGNVIKRITPDGGEYIIGYDALNRANSITEPDGSNKKAEYDALGNVTSIDYGDEIYESCQYDLLGNLTSYIDRNGYRIYCKYDQLNNITELSDDNGIINEYTYYPGGLLKSEKERNGHIREYYYDKAENVIKIIDNVSGETCFTYDENGQILEVRINDSLFEEYEYDAIGRIKKVIDGNGAQRQYNYTLNGEIKNVVDAEGNITEYTYDKCNNLIGINYPDRCITYKRDIIGNIINVLNPDGNTVKYTYDLCNRVTGEFYDDGHFIKCCYNPDGTEKSYSFSDGREVFFSYNSLKQLIQMKDWLGVTDIEYDNVGNPLKIKNPDGSEINYEYGKSGECRNIKYSNGDSVIYDYDDQLRLKQCVTGNNSIDYNYYDNGLLRKKHFSNNAFVEYKYNLSGLVSNYSYGDSVGEIETIDYSYSPIGQINNKCIVSKGIKSNFNYYYNQIGCLSSVIKNNETVESYKYDSFGNRIYSCIDGSEAYYKYNLNNQLVVMDDKEGHHEFRYDIRGNLISEIINNQCVNKYKFGSLNLIEEAATANGSATYKYNGFGKRVEMTIKSNSLGNKQTKYIHDINRSYFSELSIISNDNIENIIWDGSYAAEFSKDNYTAIISDERLSTIYRKNNSTGFQQYSYDSFGQLSPSNTPNIEYSGHIYDPITGFKHAGLREYDSSTGRFISRDVVAGFITIPLTLNAYLYCMNDPINYYDPTGALAAWLAGGIVGAVSNVAVKAAGDVVKSITTGKIQVSPWQDYVGTATGGFAQGTVFVASGGNMTLASAAGSTAETLVSNGLKMATGEKGYRKEDGYTWKNLLNDTAISGATGAMAGAASNAKMFDSSKYIKIPGITKGRGNYQAVFKAQMTRASKGQIKNVSMKTLYKGMVAFGAVKFLDTTIKNGIDAVEDYVNDTAIGGINNIVNRIKNQIVSKNNSIESSAKKYMSSNMIDSASCPMMG